MLEEAIVNSSEEANEKGRKIFEHQFQLMHRCLINLKSYRLILDNKDSLSLNMFWTYTQNNCLQIATLDWCKLFGSKKYNQVSCDVAICSNEFDNNEFYLALYEKFKISEQEFKEYVSQIKKLRDKYVAHSEVDYKGVVPYFNLAYNCIIFYFDWMKQKYLDYHNIYYQTEIEEYISPYFIELSQAMELCKLDT